MVVWKNFLAIAAVVILAVGQTRGQEPVEEVTPPLWDNFSLFGGIEASREPQDLGINANFGANLSANLGFPILSELGLGGQVGSGINLSHAGVKVLRELEGTTHREQWFTTAGLFERWECLHVGAVFDLEVSSYYNTFVTGQVRGEVGVQATDRDEVGLWGALSTFGDNGRVLEVDVHVQPIDQLAAYWRHRWETNAETRVWVGLAEPHGTDILIIPDRHKTDVVVTFGLEVFVPLNDYFALFGQGNFITPSDTGTLDAYLGIAFYPGGGARRASTNRFAPVLAVANNPTLSLDLERR